MLDNVRDKFIDNQFINNILSGAESMDVLDTASSMSPIGIESAFNAVTTKTDSVRIMGLLNEFRPKFIQSELFGKGSGLEHMATKAYEVDMQKGITDACEAVISNTTKYQALPESLKKRLNPLKTAYDKHTKALAGMEANDPMRFATKWTANQYKQAMEHILFNVFSGYEQQLRAGNINQKGEIKSGMEDVGRAQFAVFYPTYETALQWISCASPVYPKLVEVKDLANMITGIPVHWRTVEYEFRDASNKVIERVRREVLFSKFIPTNENAYLSNKKIVTVKAVDFNKEIDLHTTVLSGMTAPVLQPLEHVRPDFLIASMKLADIAEETDAIYDYRTGTIITETMHEIDTKGKLIPVVLDKSKPNEVYNITLYFHKADEVLKVLYQKSVPSMKDIESITFRFKGNDVNLQYRSNFTTRIVDEQVMLNAGEEIIYQMNINADEYAFIDGRRDGSYVNQQLNATSEYEINHKERIFMGEAATMMEGIRVDYEAERLIDNPEQWLAKGEGHTLYASREYNLDTRNQVFKEENLNFALAPTFEAVRADLNRAAHTQTNTQINFLAYDASLQIFNTCHKLEVGTVTEDTNGKFLGVTQTARTFVMTLGQAGSGVNAVVVGSEKWDLRPETHRLGVNIPTADIKYKFVGFPYYSDPNINTCYFMQTATRVMHTGPSDTRLLNNPALPGMSMKTSGKLQIIRKALAEVTLFGSHIRYVN